MTVSELISRLSEISGSHEVVAVLPNSVTLHEIDYLQTFEGGEQLRIIIGKDTVERI